MITLDDVIKISLILLIWLIAIGVVWQVSRTLRIVNSVLSDAQKLLNLVKDPQKLAAQGSIALNSLATETIGRQQDKLKLIVYSSLLTFLRRIVDKTDK